MQNFEEKKISIPWFMGKRRYQCTSCDKNYTRKYRLKQHVLRQYFFKKMTSAGAELIKLQEDTMKLQLRLYISLIPYTIADDKIKMLQNWDVNPTTLQPLSKTWLKNHLKEEQKQLNLGACLKKTKANWSRIMYDL